VSPANWRDIGVPVTIYELDHALWKAVGDTNVYFLSFSGGVDSCLLLYYMLKSQDDIKCFTVANSSDHPDIEYSIRALDWFRSNRKTRPNIQHHVFIIPGLEGDELVQAFYKRVRTYGRNIIAGDTVDELNCGYYSHKDCLEETYIHHLSRLQPDHLEPLNKNSGDVSVYLPYADPDVIGLFHRIPLYDKVSRTERKMVINHLADGKVPPEIIARKKYGFATTAKKIAV